MKNIIMIVAILAIMISAPFANARDEVRDSLSHEWKEQVADQKRLEAVWSARTPGERAAAYQNYVYNSPRLWAPFGN